MKKEHIKIEGHRGTWYVVDSEIINNVNVYELESEQWGDEAAHLIVNDKLEILLDDVYNGIDDYRYHLENL